MSFSNAIHICTSLHGYPQALRHFIETKAPRGKKWLDNERALYNQRSHHYRMVASESMINNEPDWFDMVLYDTPMARYFRPVNFVEKVWLRGHDSHTSWQFLYWVCCFHPNKLLLDLIGRPIHAPLSIAVHNEYMAENGVAVPRDWSAVLHLREGRVDTFSSAHRPVFSMVLSGEDKERRAAFRKTIEPLLDLMVLRKPLLHAESMLSERLGRPFALLEKKHSAMADLRFWLNEQSEAAMEALLTTFSQNVYNRALSQRACAGGRELTWTPRSAAELEPLDTKAFRSALLNALSGLLMLDRKAGRKELPQFPSELPRKYTSHN
jgi:hypothetical protein